MQTEIADYDAREEFFKEAIKGIERQRFWFPIVMLGLLAFSVWMAGGEMFEGPSLDTVYPMITLIAVFGVGVEVLNVKILLVRAEYNNWLREFRKEKWARLNMD